MSGWKYYYPDHDSGPEEATDIVGKCGSADMAADIAIEDHYHQRNGWEQMDTEIPIMVIGPDGTEYPFTGLHEASVHHSVTRCEEPTQ